jgi:3-methyl-2-oxobutanoate hydroxymethyltransferase
MNKKKKFSFVEYKELENPKPISWLTSYDYPLAHAAESANIDMILVGDSGGMVQYGFENTIPVTMEMCIEMCRAVKRGAPNTFLVGDMPFGSYEISVKEAVKNAISFIKLGGVDAIKLEGGKRVSSKIKAIHDAGIIVFGHIGLTPQSASSFGGYKVQGKSKENFDMLIEDAKALESSGASAILLEAVPEECSKMIKRNVSIPIFGIGAGGGIDGQLLIAHDILGLYPDFKPRCAKNYMNIVINDLMTINNDNKSSTDSQNFTSIFLYKKAIELYHHEVQNGEFPSEDFTYPIKEEDLAAIKTSTYWKE